MSAPSLLPTGGRLIGMLRQPVDAADLVSRGTGTFHLQGQHDQQTHGNRGGSARVIVADDPKWYGHYFTSSDRDARQPSGAPVRGTGLDPAELPDRLYHVTTNAPAVRDAAMLKAAGEGGLGGDQKDQIVSLTTNPDIAANLAASMRAMHSVAAAVGPEPEWRTPERDAWGRQVVAGFQDVARAEGWEWGGALGDHQYENYGFNEWQAQFFMARQSKTGQKNPIFFRASQEQWAAIDPTRVGVIEVAAAAVQDTGALVTDLDWKLGGGLDEVRVYGDIPLRTGRDTFHLKGTANDHNQQDHAGLRQAAAAAPDERIHPPDEWFADKELFAWAQTLAMDKARNVPKPTKERIRKNLRSIRKSKRPGGELRGNSYTRRARAEALFEEFGGAERGYCPCAHCGIKVAPRGRGGYGIMQQDKILTIHEGGTYGTARNFPNLIPSCGGCNSARNEAPFPVRPEWEDQALAASAANPLAATTKLHGEPVEATGTPIPDPDEDVTPKPVTGPYQTRTVDAWFGTYQQHIVGGQIVDPDTVETTT